MLTKPQLKSFNQGDGGNMTKLFLLVLMLISPFAYADFDKEVTVKLYSTDIKHQEIGQVNFKESRFGVLIYPKLSSLPPGLHGFHLHEHPSCEEHAMKAGGHFDPAKTNTHLGPYGNGHLGDLPALYVNEQGIANTPLLAPRLKIEQLKGLTLMIHKGGDNYSDNPPLGGGGERIACGLISR